MKVANRISGKRQWETGRLKNRLRRIHIVLRVVIPVRRDAAIYPRANLSVCRLWIGPQRGESEDNCQRA